MRITAKKLLTMALVLLAGTLWLTACSPAKNPPASPASPPEISSLEKSGSSPKADSVSEQDIIADLALKSQEISEIAYDIVIVEAGISYDSKVWYKNKKMKTDSLLNGLRTISVFDLIKGEVISYLPQENMATKLELDEYPAEDNVTPMDYAMYLKDQDYKITGAQSVNDLECHVITFSNEQGKFKEWLSKEYGIAVKFEHSFEGQTTSHEYKNIKIGPGAVPDGTFDLPKDIEIIDLNDIMSNTAPKTRASQTVAEQQ